MTRSTKKFRPLTADERRIFEQFAMLEISLHELSQRLGDMLEFDFGPRERRLTSYFLLPQPAIRIEKRHVDNALRKREAGEINGQQLSDWATMLLLNEAYGWEGPEEDDIFLSLNDLSLRTAASCEADE